ncbi:gallate dioxygenase [Bradyrhizobium sp. S3.14.4]
MARIIGGIGASHVPTIGVAYDKNKQDVPAWAPLFKGFEPAAKWLEEKKPDVLVFFYNDHLNAFFYDLYPTFALGVAPSYDVADEGAGLRPLPTLPGHPGLARHIAESVINDEFDLTVFQDRPLDHGVFSPLPLLWPHKGGWPGAVIPVEVNVVQYPLPTAMRCYRLGQALRRAIESYTEDLSVVVVGTGGLSHQIHGERTGYNDTEWDMRFIDLIEKDPMTLAKMKHVDYIRLGGAESVEVIMWLAMRGALSDDIKKVHQNYYLATTTAMTVLVFEENDQTPKKVEGVSQNPQSVRDRGYRGHLCLRHQDRHEMHSFEPVLLEHEDAGEPRGIRTRRGCGMSQRGSDRSGDHACTGPQLAGTDPVRREFLCAGEVRAVGGRDQSRGLCIDARRDLR